MNGFLFIRKNGIITGPFPCRRIQELAQQGTLDTQDEVSADKLNWIPAGRYFQDNVTETPRPSPPQPPVVHTASVSVQSVPSETVDFPETIAPVWEWQERTVLTAKEPQIPDTHSHLWIFCHLLCAMNAWNAHATTLGRRCTAVVWTALAYALIVVFASSMLFCQAYPPLRGYLWSAGGAAGLLAMAISFAFLVSGIAVHLRNSPSLTPMVTPMAMVLLTHFATLCGTVIMILHALKHPQPWAKIAALLALLLALGLFSAGSRQIFLGVVHSSDFAIRRRGALRVWCLWLFMSFLVLSAVSLFLLGQL